jgi:hypothetical protein
MEHTFKKLYDTIETMKLGNRGQFPKSIFPIPCYYWVCDEILPGTVPMNYLKSEFPTVIIFPDSRRMQDEKKE